jgi:hypothetical protein
LRRTFCDYPIDGPVGAVGMHLHRPGHANGAIASRGDSAVDQALITYRAVTRLADLAEEAPRPLVLRARTVNR